MFDTYWGDIELTTLVLIVSVIIILSIQLLLCFKTKRRTIRLLPVIMLSVLAAAFVIMNFATTGWDRLGYVILIIFSGFMMVMCGVGWGIWAIINALKKKRHSHQ